MAAKRILPKQFDGLILGGDEGEVLVWDCLFDLSSTCSNGERPPHSWHFLLHWFRLSKVIELRPARQQG